MSVHPLWVFFYAKFMERYSIIHEKNSREIVLLRGSGCVYTKCTFCDYYSDSCKNEEENFRLNSKVLENVTGIFQNLEVINSGSVFELDKNTVELIKKVCKQKNIHTIHFESHYLYNNRIADLRKEFSDFTLKIKLGLESFDYDFRENVLKKCENSTSVKPDKELIKAFIKEIYPIYKDNDRADILINNTDFGVGD